MRGKPIRGSGLINAGGCRSRAQYFLILSRQMSRPKDRAAMVEMAALWMGRAEQADQNKRIVEQRQQVQPVKEPEPSQKLVSQS